VFRVVDPHDIEQKKKFKKRRHGGVMAGAVTVE